MNVSPYLELPVRTLEQALAARLAQPGATINAPEAIFPLTLGDGSALTYEGANCYFLSPNVIARSLTIILGGEVIPVRLTRPWHGVPMKLERAAQ